VPPRDKFETKVFNTNIAHYSKKSFSASTRCINPYEGTMASLQEIELVFRRGGTGSTYYSVVPPMTTILGWVAHNNIQDFGTSGTNINGITGCA